MKKSIIACMAMLLSISLQAQRSGLGIGVILGKPTGLSAKIWTSREMALDAGVAWSFHGNGNLRVHTDLLWHRDVFDVDPGKLPVYYGVGARLLLASELGFGFRVPLGVVYDVDQVPVDIFLELVPVLDLLPVTALDLDLAIGARYFF
jgi:hypothetical protein